MGEPLYEPIVGGAVAAALHRPCRIYAPVGSHDTLLAYLVRRLLENGANTSFVHRIADGEVPLEALVEDPVRAVEAAAARDGVPGAPHPAIPLPGALHGAARINSRGLDLADEVQLASLARALQASTATPWQAAPLLAGEGRPQPPQPLRSPADARDVVGTVQEASADDVQAALAAAAAAAPRWAAEAPERRSALLDDAAARLEADTERLCALLVREAGKTWSNGVAEVREAVDFLRYYAAEARRDFDNATHRPLGPVVCISPWNFPLAIFTGQVGAALAAGNTVLAKPAEQTPLVAAEAVRALHAAGVPRDALQLLPGRGETVGAALVADARVQGVLFTGSTDVARLLQRTLATRLGAHGGPVPLVAETGGQNAMIVDSSALAEQAVHDIVASAFDSAGQRCSALRLLCVQRDAADRVAEMLAGAMREQRVGDPRALAVDVGPVIDADARAAIERHVEAMRARGRRVVQPLAEAARVAAAHGHFVAPALIEIDAVAELEREVFGPVLHLLRYERDALPALLGQIDATGYGLTGGVHTRIDETIVQTVRGLRAGNVYVNRNIVGAVVGVQPFGGSGLSGTGPKAGGPLYLLRLLAAGPPDAARRAIAAAGGEAVLPLPGLGADAADVGDAATALAALHGWALQRGEAALAARCERCAARAPDARWRTLAGPTGEANFYAVQPRDAVLCLAADDAHRLAMLAAVLAAGSRAVWPAETQALRERLPSAVRERITLAQDWTHDGVHFDAVLHGGPSDTLPCVLAALAARSGPVVGVTQLDGIEDDVPPERLVVERSLAINTAAAGGNASLMTIG
jgi:RHH-type proline utilization regulon transcriptional repressor/proline dehydrogenase/delta 1-pyrroline-5-carboxylate dehydrogenase